MQRFACSGHDVDGAHNDIVVSIPVDYGAGFLEIASRQHLAYLAVSTVGDVEQGDLVVMNVMTGAVLRRIALGAYVYEIAADSADDRVWVSTSGGNVWQVDTAAR